MNKQSFKIADFQGQSWRMLAYGVPRLKTFPICRFESLTDWRGSRRCALDSHLRKGALGKKLGRVEVMTL